MGKHEIIKDTPSSSSEAAVLPTPVSEPDATVTPKMALAGVDPGKVEMPKAAAISAPRIEIAETNTETIAAGEDGRGDKGGPPPPPPKPGRKASTGGGGGGPAKASPPPARAEGCPLCGPRQLAAGLARA